MKKVESLTLRPSVVVMLVMLAGLAAVVLHADAWGWNADAWERSWGME